MIKNKKIVLTGASSGIGLEVMKLLAADGSNTILAVARHIDGLSRAASNIIPFAADVSNKEGIDSVFAKAEELFGTVDIFYANAGTPYFEEYDYEDWDRLSYIFELNTLGPAYTYVKYKHHLNGRPGHLVYTVSAIGEMAMPGFALYSASKFGLNGFQQGIRLEMPENMKMTCIYPVSTHTNFATVAGNGVPVDLPEPVQAVTKSPVQLSRVSTSAQRASIPARSIPLPRLSLPLQARFARFILKAKQRNSESRSKAGSNIPPSKIHPALP